MKLYIGVDNSQPNIVRAVCLTLNGALWSDGVSWSKIKHFNRWAMFWKTGLHMGRPAAIASTVVGHDPFNILDWVNSQGISVTEYRDEDLRSTDGEWWRTLFEPPRHFRRAHALALRAAYEHEGPQVTEQLWQEMGRLGIRMQELQQAFNRLASLTPCPF